MDTDSAILVLDDDESILDLLQEFLGQTYSITVARDALDAVDSLHDRRCALLIVDLSLPVMTGLEFLHLLRAAPEFESLPVLAISAYPTLLRRLEPGIAQAVLAKPFSLKELSQTVARLTNLHDGSSA